MELPATFTGGISGQQVGGRRFPRYTLHLLGRYTVTADRLRWVPLAPWRRPRLVEVPWSAVHVIGPMWSVTADGWERLAIAPDRSRRFLAALEAVGFVVHYSTAWKHFVVLRPGVEPDWSRGGPPPTEEPESCS